ncbi:MAG: hypothetical protein EBS36_05420 [Actinobacteria bacterium]|nr:hypothetical protein [Actinomycetota bacterium]NBY15010.1 hypothetical protein [Actinomycetota bacterium]
MTNTVNFDPSKKSVAVICYAPISDEKLLTTLKQLFSLRPAHWRMSLQLLLDRPSDSLLKLIESLGLAITVVPVKSSRKLAKSKRFALQNISRDVEAIIWLDGRVNLNSAAYNQLNNFSTSYPSAILIGQFLDKSKSLVLAGGYQKSHLPIFGKRAVMADKLPVDVTAFDSALVFIPNVVFNKIGNLGTRASPASANRNFVRRAKRANFRTLVLPGSFGDFQ